MSADQGQELNPALLRSIDLKGEELGWDKESDTTSEADSGMDSMSSGRWYTLVHGHRFDKSH